MNPNNKCLIIVNPNSGSYTKKLEKELKRLHTQGQKIHFTQKKGDAYTYIQQLKEVPERIISIGGDGTANEIINGIKQYTKISKSPIKLGIFPAGTCNDTARHHNIKHSINTLHKLLTSQQVEKKHLIETTHEKTGDKQYGIVALVAGYIPTVTGEEISQEEKKRLGALAFWKNVLQKLNTIEDKRVIIKTPEQTHWLEAHTIVISNLPTLGKGIPIAPNKPKDKLAIITVTGSEIKNLFRGVINIARDKHENNITKYLTETTFSITSDHELHIDGETLKRGTYNIKHIHNAIEIIIPEDNNT